MNDNGHTRCRRHFQLPNKYRELDFLGDSPVIIQANFTKCLDLRMSKQVLQNSKRIGGDFGRIVRMDAYGGEHARICIRQTNGGFEIGRPVARPDGEHELQSHFACTFNNGLAVLIELFIVQMAMRIDEFHRTGLFEPGAHGYLFQESGKNGEASVNAGGDDHTLRC